MKKRRWIKNVAIWLVILGIWASVIPNIMSGDPEIEKWIIIGPPVPKDTSSSIVDADEILSDTSRSSALLSDVPTSKWTYGCTATAAGMLFGYYDRTGYVNMYTGPANGGVCPLTDLGQGTPGQGNGHPITGSCYIIATEQGLDGITSTAHADDYWIAYNSPGPDPWDGSWPEHAWDLCVADFLGTNQWKWDYDPHDGITDANTDGSTTYWSYNDGSEWHGPPDAEYGPQTECGYGCKLFAESRGYTVVTNYNQLTNTAHGHPNGFTFTEFQAEINAGRPVLTHWTSSSGGHTMLGIGYNSSTDTIYFHDTWDNNLHQCTWTGTYSGYNLELKAVTVIQLAPPPPQPPAASFTYTPPNPSNTTVISFTDTSTDPDGTIISRWWDFGNGYYSDLQNPVHCYYTDGTYTVSLTVTDDDGQSSTVTASITVGPVSILSYDPSSWNFGDITKGHTASTSFEIWNSGTGTLTYSLSESCSWVIVPQTSGNSTGEHDTISVSIDTADLPLGPESCTINITSNGGSGTFTVYVNVIPPVEVLDQQQTQCNYNSMIYATRWGGQSFTPTTNVLTRVELYVKKVGSPPADLTVSIRSTLTGADLTSVSVPASSISTTSSWVNFDFTDLELPRSLMYYLVLSTASGTFGNCYYWGYGTGNPYVNGMYSFSFNGGSTWMNYLLYDFCFKTYGYS